MIKYRLYQNTNENISSNQKWYARAVVDETYDLKKLSKHMAAHNTPFSPGSIKGVLTDMVDCIKELVLDGKGVKLDDLAIFSLGISGKGAETAKEWNVSQNISNVHLCARATGQLSTSIVTNEANFKELKEYSVNKE